MGHVNSVYFLFMSISENIANLLFLTIETLCDVTKYLKRKRSQEHFRINKIN